jgi:predicted alpha/beta superfamily hydrolase
MMIAVRNILTGTLLLFMFVSLSAVAQRKGEEPRRWVLGASEIRQVSSALTHKEYELVINLPSSYGKETSRRYPVFYFCDGYYDFPLVTMIYYDQLFDGTAPECILVGFSYKGEIADYGPLRTHDLTPTEVPGISGSGGGPDYLKVIESEFIPYVESHYRVDTTFRALGGSSLGGLFTLYAMFTRPTLFKAYVSVSPAAMWDRCWLLITEETYHQTHRDLPVALYLTGAEKEFSGDPAFIEGIKFFGQVLKKRDYDGFRYQFRVLDDSYHASSKPEGYTRGMQFIFEPLVTRKPG